MGEGPQIHAGVGSPGTPRFYALVQLAGIAEIQCAEKTKITGWKSVGLA